MKYRRYYVQGGSYFFTVVTFKRLPVFNDASVALLRETFRQIKAKYPFHINAAVVLPVHLHCVWTLPEGDANFSLRWQLIKSHFTLECRKRGFQQPIWQPRFWEYCLRNHKDFNHHVEYVHFNPVKHGYVKKPEGWPWSTIHHARAQRSVS